jgi:hypothetical protein
MRRVTAYESFSYPVGNTCQVAKKQFRHVPRLEA